MNVYSILHLARSRSCNKCTGCTVKDCGTCKNCRDMKKFGGKGRKKQKCLRRQCLLKKVCT